MKKIIGITSILATLVAPSVFAAGAVDGDCREADRATLEGKVGYGASFAWASPLAHQQVSLTDQWAGHTSLKVLNNVSVRVGPGTPAEATAQFVITTTTGVFRSPYINRDINYRNGSEYCFELGNSLKATPRDEILDISVQFMQTQGESIGIYGLGYTGVSEGALDYTLVDYLKSPVDYPKIINFDIPNNYGEYILNSDMPLPIFAIDLSLTCGDGSTHNLGFGALGYSPYGMKLNINGLCAVNSQLSINSNMLLGTAYEATEFWLHGK